MHTSFSRLGNWAIAAAAALGLQFAPAGQAQDIVCAVVKIEIRQELTLERQAFEAKMKISNGLDTLALENVDINVTFEDEAGNSVLASSNPNDTDAKFFIRLDSMQGIDDVSGAGRIAPKGVAEITWLIIPAQGAGGSSAAGVRYGVGATLNYRFGGAAEQVVVAPDVIRVKPMPLLTLDYFLPHDVFADDPLTSEQEVVEPFDLGVRVTNSGAGSAKALKIESAQPRIVENRQGLLIDFQLLSSQVDDRPVQNTLLADFGDIGPGNAKSARWQMTSSLSGTFVSFDAEYVHSDALGGALTSLLAQVNTHTLIRNVRNDLPGRDSVRDFLAKDGEAVRLYESEGGDADVQDLSSNASLSSMGTVDGQKRYRLRMPAHNGLAFVRVADPNAGSSGNYTAWRSDGKRLEAANAWRLRTLTNGGVEQRFVAVFDSNSTGDYELRFDGSSANQPPILEFSTSVVVEAGSTLNHEIRALDGDGDTVVISAVNLPDGALLTPVGNNQTLLSWTPSPQQVGEFNVIIRAADGTVVTSRDLQIVVQPPAGADSDGDGMDDDWEREHFGDLSRDGTGDFDQDSATDKQEFDHGGDPTWEDRPARIQSLLPQPNATVSQSPLAFAFENASHATQAEVEYQIEVLDAESPQVPLAQMAVAEQPIETMADLALALEEGHYLWRVGAHDGASPGDWTYGRFRFDDQGEVGVQCRAGYPEAGQVVADGRPRLSLLSQAKLPGRKLEVRFEVSNHEDFVTSLALSPWIAMSEGGETSWRVFPALPEGSSLHWRAVIRDGQEIALTCESVEFQYQSTSQIPAAIEIQASRAEAMAPRIELNAQQGGPHAGNYRVELDASPTFDSPALQTHQEVPDENGRFVWQPSVQNGGPLWVRARAESGGLAGPWSSLQLAASFDAQTASPPVALSPRDGTWVPTRWPALTVFDTPGAGEVWVEVLQSPTDTTALMRVRASGGLALLPSVLQDRQRYWWRARKEHGAALGPWSTVQSFFVIDDELNTAASFEWIGLDDDAQLRPGSVTLSWLSDDLDADAQVSIFRDTDASGADGVAIVENLSVRDVRSFDWDTSALDGESLYVYAVVADAVHSQTIYADGKLSFRTPGVAIEMVDAAASEDGDAATLTVALTAKPTHQVILPLGVDDTTELAVAPAELVFDADNWQVPQTVTLTGQDDSLVDGNQQVRFLWGPAESDDAGYSGLQGGQDGLVNADNDAAGIILQASTVPVVVSEEGGSASLSLRLSTRPTHPVTLHLSSSDVTEAEVAPLTATFTAENWDETQVVVLAGVDDPEIDGDISLQFGVSRIETDDAAYAQLAPVLLSAVNLDDEQVGLEVVPGTIEVDESGAQQIIQVRLNARPTSEVVVRLGSQPAGVVELSDLSLQFDRDNWNQAQALVVTGLDDGEPTGDRAFELRFGPVESQDQRFAALSPLLVPGVNRARLAAGGMQVGQEQATHWQPGMARRVPLAQVFATAPAVFPTWVSDDSRPFALRVIAVTPQYFDVVLLRPDGDESSLSHGRLSFLAAEYGDRRLPDGRRILIGKVASSQALPNAQGAWRSVDFGAPFASVPMVLTQLQSLNNRSNGSSLSTSPWLTAVADAATASGVQVAMERSETTSGVLAEESLAFLAVEGGAQGVFDAEGLALEYESQRLVASVAGIQSGCAALPHGRDRDQSPLVFAAKSDRLSNDGGWARVCQENRSHARLAIDEDAEGDAEREQEPSGVSALAFSHAFTTQLQPSQVGVLVDRRFGLRLFEDGHGAAVGVRLSTAPEAPIAIPVSLSASSGLALSTSSLTFDAENWSDVQWIRVDAVGEVTESQTSVQLQLGSPTGDDQRFALRGSQSIELEVLQSGTWRHTFDNVAPLFSAVGAWKASTAVSGYLGSNYLAHVANGESPDSIVIDNSASGFSTTGQWTASTAVSGYIGANYLFKLPGDPQETALMDDSRAEFTGTWGNSTSVAGYFGSGYRTAAKGDGSLRAKWPLSAVPAGEYRVLARWTAHSNRADNAPFSVSHVGGVDTVRVNQKIDGAKWVSLGTYQLDSNSFVELSNAANGYVIADAVKIVAVDAPPNQAAWQANLPTAGEYEVFARWTAHQNRATDAVYAVEHAAGVTRVVVNQTQTGATWVSLGRFDFSTAVPARVSLSDQADSYVIADAVRFVPENGGRNRAQWQLQDLRLGQYDVYGRWTAHSNRASNAAYRLQGLRGSLMAIVDQRTDGARWNSLGTVTLSRDYPGSVELSDQANGYVIADAVRVQDRSLAGPYGSQLVDDTQGTTVGTWSNSTSAAGYFDQGYRAAPAGTGSARFEWRLAAATEGEYRVYARWTSGKNRASNAPYAISHVEGDSVIRVDQKVGGGRWVLLGTYRLDAQSRIVLADDANGYVIADAIRVEPAHYPQPAN
ncbi:hypothetical protein IFO71_20670 [Pseudoxanthomonas sp. CAU 1598]|uniref:Golvesin/Xly CBD-like domain-containing protein n=2 Tax=Pseudomarimonas arenosa TaxID=2774145 RepID=A0AAW3ZRK2_9GAMM|nr:hypothetical protein [Pseudomarimonas arenosa]